MMLSGTGSRVQRKPRQIVFFDFSQHEAKLLLLIRLWKREIERNYHEKSRKPKSDLSRMCFSFFFFFFFCIKGVLHASCLLELEKEKKRRKRIFILVENQKKK